MKKLFLRIIILVSILFVLDFIFGVIFRHVIDISPDGRYYKANYSLTHIDEDIVIFGSSRAETNYVPFVFEDSLKLRTWNTGRGGQSLPFWYAMELGVLNTKIPKIAIINIESSFLSEDMRNGYERAGFLRPFYYKHPEIRPVIDNISSSEKFLMLSNIYAFNSSFYYLLRPFLVRGLDGKKDLKGWKTKEGMVNKIDDKYLIINSNGILNNETIDLFNIFIDNLTNKGCYVFIIVSPNYKQLIKYSSTIEYVSKMEKVTLLNYANNKYFVDNNLYFKDPSHLNVEGAVEFSKWICSEIKNKKALTYNE